MKTSQRVSPVKLLHFLIGTVTACVFVYVVPYKLQICFTFGVAVVTGLIGTAVVQALSVPDVDGEPYYKYLQDSRKEMTQWLQGDVGEGVGDGEGEGELQK